MKKVDKLTKKIFQYIIPKSLRTLAHIWGHGIEKKIYQLILMTKRNVLKIYSKFQ